MPKSSSHQRRIYCPQDRPQSNKLWLSLGWQNWSSCTCNLNLVYFRTRHSRVAFYCRIVRKQSASTCLNRATELCVQRRERQSGWPVMTTPKHFFSNIPSLRGVGACSLQLPSKLTATAVSIPQYARMSFLQLLAVLPADPLQRHVVWAPGFKSNVGLFGPGLCSPTAFFGGSLGGCIHGAGWAGLSAGDARLSVRAQWLQTACLLAAPALLLGRVMLRGLARRWPWHFRQPGHLGAGRNGSIGTARIRWWVASLTAGKAAERAWTPERPCMSHTGNKGPANDELLSGNQRNLRFLAGYSVKQLHLRRESNEALAESCRTSSAVPWRRRPTRLLIDPSTAVSSTNITQLWLCHTIAVVILYCSLRDTRFTSTW